MDKRWRSGVRGEVVTFDVSKGYGFIEPADGGEDVFMHVNDLLFDKQEARVGLMVEFEREEGPKGPKSFDVRRIEDGLAQPRSEGQGSAQSQSRDLSQNQSQPVAQPVTAPSSTRDAVSPEASASSPYRGAEADIPDEEDAVRDLTEILLRVQPALSADQVLAIRGAVVSHGRENGWFAP